MKKLILYLLLIATLLAILTIFTSCNEATDIQYNIRYDADKFRTYRKVTVINLRSDKVLLEIEGYISIKDSTSTELAIIVKTGPTDYYMHYVYTGSEIVYLVEQLEPISEDPYYHKVNIYAIIPKIEIGTN